MSRTSEPSGPSISLKVSQNNLAKGRIADLPLINIRLLIIDKPHLSRMRMDSSDFDPHLAHCSFDQHELAPNGISISSAVFARLNLLPKPAKSYA